MWELWKQDTSKERWANGHHSWVIEGIPGREEELRALYSEANCIFLLHTNFQEYNDTFEDIEYIQDYPPPINPFGFVQNAPWEVPIEIPPFRYIEIVPTEPPGWSQLDYSMDSYQWSYAEGGAILILTLTIILTMTQAEARYRPNILIDVDTEERMIDMLIFPFGTPSVPGRQRKQIA